MMKKQPEEVLRVLSAEDRDIIRALADHRMLVTEAAYAVHLSRNTVYYRLYRMERLTGWSARDFHDLTALLQLLDAEEAGHDV